MDPSILGILICNIPHISIHGAIPLEARVTTGTIGEAWRGKASYTLVELQQQQSRSQTFTSEGHLPIAAIIAVVVVHLFTRLGWGTLPLAFPMTPLLVPTAMMVLGLITVPMVVTGRVLALWGKERGAQPQ